MGVRTWPSWDRLRPSKLLLQFNNTLRQCWHLGLTSFGGPPVHFKIVSLLVLARGVASHAYIAPVELSFFVAAAGVQNSGAATYNVSQFHDKFVDRLGWIDEQMVSSSHPPRVAPTLGVAKMPLP